MTNNEALEILLEEIDGEFITGVSHTWDEINEAKLQLQKLIQKEELR